MRGTVKWFSPQKGYGFIRRIDLKLKRKYGGVSSKYAAYGRGKYCNETKDNNTATV